MVLSSGTDMVGRKVVMTGYEDVLGPVDEGKLIRKPFRPAELLERVGVELQDQ